MAAELAAFAPSSTPAVQAAAPVGWGAGAGGDTSRASTYVGPDDDLVPAGESPIRAMVATLFGSKRNIALVAGGALLLVIVIAFATGGSKDKAKAVASKTETAKKTPAIEPTPGKAPEDKVTETPAADREKVAAVDTPTPTETPTEAPVETPAAGSDATATEPVANADAATPATGTPKTPATGTAKVVTGAKLPATGGSKKTLGGKQVVLEYDAQAKEAAKPVATAPKNEQAAILKARASYALGNQKLMAGDWNGAILKYRQSLANYPGYVAGYRGLGLAFMQMGDKPKALQALRLYLSSVPNAKDAGLIRKRIETLQR